MCCTHVRTVAASVLVEVAIETPFIIYILLSSSAPVPLNGVCPNGPGFVGAMPVLGTLALLSFDISAEEAAASPAIKAGLARLTAMMLMDDTLCPPSGSRQH
jgi:hypothetical protein